MNCVLMLEYKLNYLHRYIYLFLTANLLVWSQQAKGVPFLPTNSNRIWDKLEPLTSR